MGDGMDLDSVQKKTVPTASDRLFHLFPVPEFQDWMTSAFLVFCNFWPFCVYFSLIHDNRILGMFGAFLSLYGKYKQVRDFGNNNGSLVRILKSLKILKTKVVW